MRVGVVALLIVFFSYTLLANQTKKLDIITGKSIDKKQVYQALGIKLPLWYEFWKDKTPKVNPKISASLFESLGYFYKAQGFYHANLDKNETNSTITFKIIESKAAQVKKINIDSDYDISSLITFKPKKRFISTQFIQIKKEIKNEMLKKGYCNYKIDAKAKVDILKNEVELFYKLDKNNLCKFGKITIDKIKDIEKKVILSRLTFKEKDQYSQQKINESYSTLSGLEAFDTISINSDTNGDLINIGVLLKPKTKKNRIEAGLGYETNIGPRALLRYQKTNFKGNAKKIGLDLKYSQKEKFITSSIFWPALIEIPEFKGYYLDLKSELSYSEIEYEKFNEEKSSIYLHLLKDYYKFSVDFGLAYEKIKIKKIIEICNISDGNFNLLFPFVKLGIDLRDSKINPKNGFYLTQYFEIGLEFLKDSSTYSKSITEVRAIKSFNSFTLAAKAKLGLIEEFANRLPESKLFFAGGAFSNRGYGYNALGSFDANCNEIGGRTLIDTTLEMSYPIYKKFHGALFYDSTLLSSKEHRFSVDFIHSIGIGARYLLPIGPIKFDFGMDIEDKSQYALHFQIGQSF